MPVVAGMTDLIRQQVKDLPPLPRVVTKLVQVVGDDRSGAAEDVTACWRATRPSPARSSSW